MGAASDVSTPDRGHRQLADLTTRGNSSSTSIWDAATGLIVGCDRQNRRNVESCRASYEKLRRPQLHFALPG